MSKPKTNLFIPLYARFFTEFKEGRKHAEFRDYGPRWNERTCRIGRKVTLSNGYGKQNRLSAVIRDFERNGSMAIIHLSSITPL